MRGTSPHGSAPHLVEENVILTKESRSSEKFIHGINVLMAKNYIDNLSEEVKKGVRTKSRARRLWPSFAPLGYLNTVRSDGKRVIVPDPVLGPIVTNLFESFASGEYSLKGAYQQGFRFFLQKPGKNSRHDVAQGPAQADLHGRL